jgi:hypothetical protein
LWFKIISSFHFVFDLFFKGDKLFDMLKILSLIFWQNGLQIDVKWTTMDRNVHFYKNSEAINRELDVTRRIRHLPFWIIMRCWKTFWDHLRILETWRLKTVEVILNGKLNSKLFRGVSSVAKYNKVFKCKRERTPCDVTIVTT